MEKFFFTAAVTDCTVHTHPVIGVTVIMSLQNDGRFVMTAHFSWQLHQSKGVCANETEREGCEKECTRVCACALYVCMPSVTGTRSRHLGCARARFP